MATTRTAGDRGGALGFGVIAALLMALLATTLTPASAVAADPAIDSVTPIRHGSLLASLVRMSNLPGDGLAKSLRSGLPSAIELELDLRDDQDRTVLERKVMYRVAFDLWEEIFRIEGPGAVASFPTIDALEAYLDELPRVSVAPLEGLAVDSRHRLRVGCRLHRVAPREAAQVSEWVGEPGATERQRNRDATDEREVSVSLAKVIRFFYRGGKANELEDERFSAWFVPDELPDLAAVSSPAPDGEAGAGDIEAERLDGNRRPAAGRASNDGAPTP